MQSSDAVPLSRGQLNSPLSFPKMWSLLELPILFLQDAESAQIVHCVFKKCGVHMNSTLCRVQPTPHCDFQQCRVCLNSPFYFPKKKNRVCLNSPLCFYKHALPCSAENICGVHLKDEELVKFSTISVEHLPSSFKSYSTICNAENLQK